MTHNTAISRKTPSLPLRWLNSCNLLNGTLLDYGSGRGMDSWFYKMDKWDPYWAPGFPEGPYDTITCTYVFNILSQNKRSNALYEITKLLKNKGSAYITVRRDLPKFTQRAAAKGRLGSSTQYYVKLSLPCIRETSTYAIYKLEK